MICVQYGDDVMPTAFARSGTLGGGMGVWKDVMIVGIREYKSNRPGAAFRRGRWGIYAMFLHEFSS